MNLSRHGLAGPPRPLRLVAAGRTEESIDIIFGSPKVSERVYCVSACLAVYIVYDDGDEAKESSCSEHRASATVRSPERNLQIRLFRDDSHTAVLTGPGVYSDTGLQPGTLYQYKFMACSKLGCSEPREVAAITEVAGKTVPPDAPAYLRGKEVPDGVEVWWSPVDGATYFEVDSNVESTAQISGYRPPRGVSAPLTHYYDSSPNRSYTGASFLRGDLLPTTYSVKACNKAGCSAPSPTATVH